MNATVSLTVTFTQDKIIRLVVAAGAVSVISALATNPSPTPYPLTGVATLATTVVAFYY